MVRMQWLPALLVVAVIQLSPLLYDGLLSLALVR